MNLRDDITECGYCGGKIARRKERAAADAGKFTLPRAGQGHKGAAAPKKPSGEAGAEDEEEEGGLSAVLLPGEQILIGSLNVSVKKFSFHAYLTNQRIFLIDTQEKKIKVTAKDVSRDTIAGSIVEFSDSSDPVLVLSLRSGEDEIKTMKLVFVQSGTDRSAEIDEWITLLQGEEPAPVKKAQKQPARAREPVPEEEPEEEYPPVRRPQKRPAPAVAKAQEPIAEEEYPEEEEEAEEPAPVRVPERARPRHELQPAKRPIKKDHERQPPVKRLHSLYNVPEEEPLPEEEPAPEPEVMAPPRRVPVKQVIATTYERETPPYRGEEEPAVAKPAVQSAMKVAMKSAIRQTGPVSPRPVRKPVIEPSPVSLPEEEPAPAAARRPVVQESRAAPVQERPERDEVKEATPQFCHNCGKKLPHSANFCPGCGTKLNVGRTLPHSRTSPSLTRKMTRTDPPGHEHRPVQVDEEEIEEEKPVPTKPPVKKAPKGSEMTILHKFLRR
jgi:hypothetical protein